MSPAAACWASDCDAAALVDVEVELDPQPAASNAALAARTPARRKHLAEFIGRWCSETAENLLNESDSARLRSGSPHHPQPMPAMRPLVFVAAGVILAYLVGCSAAAPRSPRPVASGRSTDSSAGASSPSTTHVRRALFTRPAAFRLPVPVSGEAVAARDGELIVLGGLDANGVSTSSVTALDTVRGRVRAAGAPAEPLHDEGAASVGATTLVFGGGSSAGTDAIESLSPGAAAARFAGKLPTPRSDAVALSLGGRAYVVGGYDGATLSSGVLATADGRRVRSVARLPVPVRYPAVAALGDSIYVAGGLTAAGSATDVIQVVHPRSGTARRI